MRTFEAKYTNGSTCFYCDIPTKRVGSWMINGQPHADVLYCARCGAWINTQFGREMALGSVANATVRQLRQRVHLLLEPTWKQFYEQFYGTPKGRCINACYEALGVLMGLPPEHSHVSMFQLEECRKALHLNRDMLADISFMNLKL